MRWIYHRRVPGLPAGPARLPDHPHQAAGKPVRSPALVRVVITDGEQRPQLGELRVEAGEACDIVRQLGWPRLTAGAARVSDRGRGRIESASSRAASETQRSRSAMRAGYDVETEQVAYERSARTAAAAASPMTLSTDGFVSANESLRVKTVTA